MQNNSRGSNSGVEICMAAVGKHPETETWKESRGEADMHKNSRASNSEAEARAQSSEIRTHKHKHACRHHRFTLTNKNMHNPGREFHLGKE